LHAKAKAAGGYLKKVRRATPGQFYADLASLIKASDDVLLVQIRDNHCDLSPSGDDPITQYSADIIRRWKGFEREQVTFSVPMGLIIFDEQRKTRASTSIEGFQPFLNGHRYLVFLRFSNAGERQLTPARRLTGDAIQGGFELVNELVHPMYRLDPIFKKYENASVPAFLGEITTVAASQGAPPPSPLVDAASASVLTRATQFLLPVTLKEAGIYLPSYFPTMLDFDWYQQSRSPTERLIVDWDSWPGAAETVRREQFKELVAASRFTLLERKRNFREGIGKTGANSINGDSLIMAAVTSMNEVRALTVFADPRYWHTEDLRPGQQKSHEFVSPRRTLCLGIPDDPEIQTIIFYKPHLKSEIDPSQGWRLEKLGTLKLK
jgi:hypothetical protein